MANNVCAEAEDYLDGGATTSFEGRASQSLGATTSAWQSCGPDSTPVGQEGGTITLVGPEGLLSQYVLSSGPGELSIKPKIIILDS